MVAFQREPPAETLGILVAGKLDFQRDKRAHCAPLSYRRPAVLSARPDASGRLVVMASQMAVFPDPLRCGGESGKGCFSWNDCSTLASDLPHVAKKGCQLTQPVLSHGLGMTLPRILFSCVLALSWVEPPRTGPAGDTARGRTLILPYVPAFATSNLGSVSVCNVFFSAFDPPFPPVSGPAVTGQSCARRAPLGLGPSQGGVALPHNFPPPS